MIPCKFIRFLFFLVPFRPWQDFLVRKHLDPCPVCSGLLARKEEVRKLLVAGESLEPSPELWPAARAGMEAGKRPVENLRRSAWKAALAAAAAAAVLAAAFLVWPTFRQGGKRPVQEPASRFLVSFVRVGGEPATPFIYQPSGSGMIIVWAEKNL